VNGILGALLFAFLGGDGRFSLKEEEFKSRGFVVFILPISFFEEVIVSFGLTIIS
jgi:hypothetical protein